MVDREVLTAHGLDADGLRKKFEGNRQKRSDKVNELIDRMVNRCRGGRDVNFEKYNIYRALDTAWDSAFDQISPTLLQTLYDKSPDSPDVLEILRGAGLDPNRVISEVPDPKTPGKSYKRVEVPAFFKITVPLCMAYVKIRQAKLVNDRKQVPFFKYEPVISDQISRLRCGVITEAIEEQTRQYGYFDIFKQIIFQMLHYAEVLQFPVEEWHTESQWYEEDSPYEKEEDTEEKEIDGIKMKRVVVKEGIRYHTPHPSRVYVDRAYPAHTINTNTGVTYAGYWRVLRFCDVLDKEGYYNLDTIGYDNFYSWFEGKKSHGYWVNVTRGCSIDFPSTPDEGGTSKHDSEKAVGRWYSRDMADKPIVLTEHFEKLIPKDFGLGSYDCPVWIRFVIAADDTVIYAAPLAYDPPIIWWGYDFVHGRTHNASMTLEVLPFQDQFSNLLAQHLLSVRQNLMNVSFVDTEIMEEKQIEKLENLGERFWRSINIVRVKFSEILKRKAGLNMSTDPLRSAVISHKFPVQNTTETLNAMKVILDTLERVLVMSAQEVGQSASHEQTREEVRQISTNTSTRVTFTNTGVDSAIDAWKKQLYAAKMSYGKLSYYAHVALEIPISSEELKKLGFTAQGEFDERTRKQLVKGNRTALKYEIFASDRDGQNRVSEIESAKVMLQVFNNAMNNQILAPAIGPDQGLKMINQIARFLGFPRDFKFENTGQQQSQQEQMQQMMQQLQQYMDQSLQALQGDIKGALQNVMEKNQQQDQALAQVMQRFQQLMGMANGAPQRPPMPEDMDMQQPVPAPVAARATPQEMAAAGITSI